VDQELSPPEAARQTEEGERIYELVPMAPRVVGPGRRERAYLERLDGLRAELEAASLVERGSARRLDRMERKLAAVREAAAALEQREHRLILALGAMQRENELLNERLVLTLAPKKPAPKTSWLGRILRRS
jgi:hypothetical protein